jgi:O-Antigen ligase
MISLVLIPISIFIFLKLNRSNQFIVFSLAALYPFTFGDLRSIPDLLIVEWLTLVTFLSLINELNPVRSVERKLKRIKFTGIEIFIFAFILIITWTLISIINNEIINPPITTGNSTGTKRIYFTIFNCALLFFTTIIFYSSQSEKIDIQSFLKVLLNTTLFIGFIRVFTFYFQLNTPLLSGLFQYNSGAMAEASGVAYRFSGLDYAATIGIPALFALYVYKGKLNIFALVILFVFLFLSGGRTIMMGALVAIIIFSFLFLPKNFIYLIVGGCIVFLLSIIILPQTFLEGQLSRFSTLKEKSFMGQDAWRGMAWYLYFKNFVDHPVFGKGITEFSGFIYSPIKGTEDFARHQLFAGGHGAYFSLLSTFGIGGIIYFIIVLWGGIILSFRKIRQYVAYKQDRTAIAVFCFMILIIIAVNSITGSNGFDIPYLYYSVGLVCSLKVLENSDLNLPDDIEEYSQAVEESGSH